MKIKRNDPCPCGSGKKVKKCCMGKIKSFAHRVSEGERPEALMVEDIMRNTGMLNSK